MTRQSKDTAYKTADEAVARMAASFRKYWPNTRTWSDADVRLIECDAAAVAFGFRDALLARGLCIAEDFPVGRKRVASNKDCTRGHWHLERHAGGLWCLHVWFSGPVPFAEMRGIRVKGPDCLDAYRRVTAAAAAAAASVRIHAERARADDAFQGFMLRTLKRVKAERRAQEAGGGNG